MKSLNDRAVEILLYCFREKINPYYERKMRSIIRDSVTCYKASTFSFTFVTKPCEMRTIK